MSSLESIRKAHIIVWGAYLFLSLRAPLISSTEYFLLIFFSVSLFNSIATYILCEE